MARSRKVNAIAGQTFTLARVTPYRAAVKSDDGKVTIYAERPRGAVIGNVGTIVRMVKGHAVTSVAKSGTVNVTRADLLDWFEAAGTPELAERFPEHGEPTVPSDPELSARFAAWLADQDELVIGDDEAAAVAAL